MTTADLLAALRTGANGSSRPALADQHAPSGGVLSAACFALLAAWLGLALWRSHLQFDDAYMFYRYALNLRDGLGIAWNPDGVQTYGLTSHLWLLAVLPFTVLPLEPGVALQVASTLAAAAAITTLGLTVARHATSDALSDRSLAIAVVGLPLVLNPAFVPNVTNGMDTMASLLAHACIVLAVLGYARTPTQHNAVVVGLVAFAAVLTRPENGLCALGVPLLMFMQMGARRRWSHLLGLTVLPALLIALELVVCAWVFGAPLPLSFYAKALHAYANFQNPENPVRYLLLGVFCALPFIAVLLVVAPRRLLGWLAAFLLPVAATAMYLLTVRQVMGMSGRYFVPFLPYVIVPATLMLDGALAATTDRRSLVRRVGSVFAGLLVAAAVTSPVQAVVCDAYMRLVLPTDVAMPSLPIRSAEPVPQLDWFDVMVRLVDDVVRPLPAQAVVAASEVGYLGVAAPKVSVIDLVGLNDTAIGTRGFSMDDLLGRQPDLIWFPHHDYTGLRARMFADQRLYQRYLVLPDAFNYGIAIRRDGPFRALIEHNAGVAWSRLYPGEEMARHVAERGPSR